eukprot:6824772-Alexandrium_andersonii.AAC.1
MAERWRVFELAWPLVSARLRAEQQHAQTFHASHFPSILVARSAMAPACRGRGLDKHPRERWQCAA